MSRRILMMVGGDLVLGLSLLVVINALFLGTTSGVVSMPMDSPLLLLGICLILIAAKYGVQLYSFYCMDRHEFEKRVLRFVAASLLPALLLITFFIVRPQLHISSTHLNLALVLFSLTQLFLISMIYQTGEQVRKPQNILVFGDGPLARWIADSIETTHGRHRFCGYIHPRKSDGEEGLDCEEILTTVRRQEIDKIVVALTERRGVLPVRDMFSCKLRGVEVVDAATFYEKTTGKLLLEHISPGWFVFSKGFLVTRLMFMKQRVIDVVASSLLLLVVLPFFPLIALIIRLESPGEIFFRQTRVGFKEKPFELIKFRTMRADAEQGSGAVWASENDPRITRCGRIMRKFRIDELPQLFNVLKGEMSFIGPRPERPEFVARLKSKVPYYSRRHAVRPGLTGWAQIRYPYGASDEDALEKLRYDLYFIKNFSIPLELRIILGTFRVVLFGKGGR